MTQAVNGRVRVSQVFSRQSQGFWSPLFQRFTLPQLLHYPPSSQLAFRVSYFSFEQPTKASTCLKIRKQQWRTIMSQPAWERRNLESDQGESDATTALFPSAQSLTTCSLTSSWSSRREDKQTFAELTYLVSDLLSFFAWQLSTVCSFPWPVCR